jgi:hypothetical protein
MSLIDIVAAAIVSLHPPPMSGETIDRYAADIAAAAEGDVDVALALVVIQDAESTWRESVETCKVKGDGGRAISAFQMHKHWWGGKTSKEVCGSNKLAAELAANVIDVLSHRTGGIAGALRAYVGCNPGDPRSVRRIRNFKRLQVNAQKPELMS